MTTPDERRQTALALLWKGSWLALGLDTQDGLYTRIFRRITFDLQPFPADQFEMARRFRERAAETDTWAQELDPTKDTP